MGLDADGLFGNGDSEEAEGMIEEEAIAFYKPFPMKKMSVGSLVKYLFGQIAPADLAMMVIAMLIVSCHQPVMGVKFFEQTPYPPEPRSEELPEGVL